MATKQEIQIIKTNNERNIQGLRTKPQEFIYELTRGFVKSNMLYSIYYTFDKDEIYLTGVTQSTSCICSPTCVLGGRVGDGDGRSLSLGYLDQRLVRYSDSLLSLAS